MGREFLRCDLLLGHELEQHGCGVRVDQAHTDVDVLDPKALYVQLHWLAMDPYVGDIATGSHNFGAHAESRGNTHSFDGNVNALPVRQRHNLLFPVGVAGKYGICSAEFLGLGKSIGIKVQGDNAGSPVETCCCDSCKAHGPCADNCDNVAGLDPAVLHTDFEACGKNVREHHCLLVADSLRQAVQGVLRVGHADIFRLGAVDQMTEDPTDARLAFITQTVGVKSGLAVRAVAAGLDAGDDDAVAHLQAGNRGAGLRNGPHSFVAKNAALFHRGHITFEDMQIGAADGGGVHLDNDVTGVLDLRIGNVLPGFFSGTTVDEGFHASSLELKVSTLFRGASQLKNDVLALRREGTKDLDDEVWSFPHKTGRRPLPEAATTGENVSMGEPRTDLGKESGKSKSIGGGSWRRLYLIAGLASILFVLLLIVALVLDFMAPPPVHGGAATLEFIAENKTVYIAEQVLWILPNIFPVVVFVALFIALAPLDKSLALLATVIGAVPWALILAVPVTSRGSLNLVYLSDRYSATTSEEERRSFATAAEAIVAENNTPAIVGVLSALGILLISLVMVKGVLPRFLAWLGIITGALGVVSEVLRHAVPEFYWGYGILLWVWFIATGIALIALARRTTPDTMAADHITARR